MSVSEVEKLIERNTQKLSDEKYLCPLSGKKFKAPEYVRKHIFNKHANHVDDVKREVSVGGQGRREGRKRGGEGRGREGRGGRGNKGESGEGEVRKEENRGEGRGLVDHSMVESRL